MDGYQFSASVISSISWPVVILVICYNLRSQLPSLAKRLKEFSFPGGGAKFENAVDEAVVTFEAVENEKPIEVIDVDQKDDHANQIQLDKFHDRNFIELATRYPQAAIFQSFKEVEDIYIKTLGMPSRGVSGIRDTISDLVSGGYLSQVDMHLFDQIRRIRNRAVHEEFKDITVGAVINYKNLCDSFAERLRATLISKFRPDLDAGDN